jgi:sigma-B regulation protein RsbU (phosphoserine phosphatase)
VLVVLGLVVLGFALARRRDRSARLLLLFGPIAVLYGLRLAASTELVRQAFPAERLWAYVRVDATYLLPVLFLGFFEELHGSGWRRSLTWCRIVWTAYAAVALVVDAVRGPGAAMGPNGPLVVIMIVLVTVSTLREGKLGGRGLLLVRVAGVVLAVVAGLKNLNDLGLFPWRPPEEVGFALLVAALCALAIERYATSERRLLELSTDLRTAQRIQQSLLPREQPALARGSDAPFALAARFRPAAAVGGDLYDWVESDDGAGRRRLTLLVADVAGHGVPAALLGALVKMAHSVLSPAAPAPGAALASLNDALFGKLERSFVTAVLVELDVDGDAVALRYANGGHPPPLLCGVRDDAPRELAATGAVLGRFRGARFADGATPFAPKDRLLLFSDGLLEAPGPAGEAFGEERVRAALVDRRALGAEEFADRLLTDLAAWRAGAPKHASEREDDVTLLVLDRRSEIQA